MGMFDADITASSKLIKGGGLLKGLKAQKFLENLLTNEEEAAKFEGMSLQELTDYFTADRVKLGKYTLYSPLRSKTGTTSMTLSRLTRADSFRFLPSKTTMSVPSMTMVFSDDRAYHRPFSW